MEIPNATKRYTARFTTDLRSSPGADAIPAAALPYKIPPKKTYPAVINYSVTTAPAIPLIENTLHLCTLFLKNAHAITGIMVLIKSVGNAHIA